MKNNLMHKENNLPLLIPAAGLGSRLFPATWGIPKELFPLGNKPALHYILEEAIFANLKDIICITSPRKESLTTYLSYKDSNNEILLTRDEKSRLSELNALNSSLEYEFFIQENAKGVANAILCAKKKLKEFKYFCMAYPDDIILNLAHGIADLIKYNEKYDCTVLLVEKVPKNKISSYGIIKFNKSLENNIFDVLEIVEKPSQENAPSDFGIIGRFLLSSKIVEEMANMKNPCFIESMNKFIKDGNRIIAICLNSIRYDIGNVSGWIEAVNAINSSAYINNNFILEKSLNI